TRQLTTNVSATIDTIAHHMPDVEHTCFCISFFAPGMLILHYYFRYAEACAYTPMEQIRRFVYWERQVNRIACSTFLSFLHHKATTYRIECFCYLAAIVE